MMVSSIERWKDVELSKDASLDGVRLKDAG